MMALRSDPDLLVQHGVERHGIPSAVREVPPSVSPSRDYVMGPMNVAARTCGSLEEWVRPSATKIPAALGNPRRCGRNDIRPTDPARDRAGVALRAALDPRPAGRGHRMKRSRAVLVVFVIIGLAVATVGLAVRLPSANPTGS